MFAATFFAQTRQVPSLLTMQAPTGLAGVQAFRNRGHWFGFDFTDYDLVTLAACMDVFALCFFEVIFFACIILGK